MISSEIEKSLLISVTEPIDRRLELLGGTITEVEKNLKLPKGKNRLKPTVRLCGKLTTVISSIKRAPSATLDQLRLVAGYDGRVALWNPRRQANQPSKKDDSDLVAACRNSSNEDDSDEMPSPADVWDAPPPLPFEEGIRLIEIQQPHSVYKFGESVLRPGADSRAMIQDALNGRAFNIPTLLRLYKHMRESFSSG